MTAPTDTIKRVLEQHDTVREHTVIEDGICIECRCGFTVPAVPSTWDTDWAAAHANHRAHVAAEIQKALGLVRETRIDTRAAALWSATVPVSPDVVARLVRPEERYATPWAPRQSAQETRSRPNAGDGPTGKRRPQMGAQADVLDCPATCGPLGTGPCCTDRLPEGLNHP